MYIICIVLASDQSLNLRSIVGVAAISVLKDGTVVITEVVWIELRDLVNVGGTDTVGVVDTEVSVGDTTLKVGVSMAVVVGPVCLEKQSVMYSLYSDLFFCKY